MDLHKNYILHNKNLTGRVLKWSRLLCYSRRTCQAWLEPLWSHTSFVDTSSPKPIGGWERQ